MTPIDHPSPNHGPRDGEAVSVIVLHYTGMQTGDEALSRMCDPEVGVSAHYMIEEDGRLFQLVDEARCAWHAGVSFWRGQEGVNRRSIGVEIVNPGHFWGYRDFTDAQMETLMTLLTAMVQRHGVSPLNLVGHSDVAPDRKDDPGERFPWDRLAAAGLALPPDAGTGNEIAFEAAIAALSEIGYRVDDKSPVAATLAFQRRFCPSELGQGLNPATRCAIDATVRRVRAITV